VTAAAVASSRRISAGIRPDPGATSRLPAWWGADDWLQEVREALDVETCREHRIAADTVLSVARAHAAFADYRTGRDCRPTNERLTAAAQVSLSTIKRGRRVLKRLGLLVELVRGRSIMTYAERIEAWKRGSSHRQIAAEFALCSRRRRAPKTSTAKVGEGANDLGAVAHIVEGDPPPGAKNVSSLSHLRSTRLRRQTEKNDEAPLRGTAPKSTDRRAGGLHPGTERLAQDVRRRVGWLGGVSARRITPTLSRFARAGWTVRDVELAVRDVLTRRSWHVPRTLTQPAAYLAGLLRELDPADRPTAAEEHARQLERAEDAYRLQLATGAPCPHGRPAGDVPSPTRRLLACPECRTAAAARTIPW
jgi:hypothetical protein